MIEVIEFAKAYVSLGWAVQEQLDLVLDGSGEECNVNAIELMVERLANRFEGTDNDELAVIVECIRDAASSRNGAGVILTREQAHAIYYLLDRVAFQYDTIRHAQLQLKVGNSRGGTYLAPDDVELVREIVDSCGYGEAENVIELMGWGEDDEDDEDEQ